MRSLGDCRLYGIIDLAYVQPAQISSVARELISGGVDILQLRGKDHTVENLARWASELHAITSAAGVPLIINDHPQIAREVRVEGVHVGQDDLPVASAREIAGRACWIGKSTHSFEQALAAECEGADYIGFGPLFPTPTKPDYTAIGLHDIAPVYNTVRLPIFCIGGIKLENLANVLGAGAKRVVIVSGLLLANDRAEYARKANALLHGHPERSRGIPLHNRT